MASRHDNLSKRLAGSSAAHSWAEPGRGRSERRSPHSPALVSPGLVSPDVTPPDAVDLLTDMLATSRTQGALFARSWLPERWGFRFRAEHAQCFHIIVKGPCYLRLEGAESFEPLGDHDIVLVGGNHDLASEPEAPIETFSPALPALRTPPGYGGCIACGAYAYDDQGPHPIFAQLPTLIRLPGSRLPARIRRVVELLLEELETPGAGSRTLTQRLVDALLIFILRDWIEGDGERRGWLAALRDPNLARALGLMHGELDQPWTLASLARASGLSRAALARRFHAAVEVPPMEFLRRRRLEKARLMLRASELSIDEIAIRVGYANGFSLSKAFSKAFDEAPGAFRLRTRMPSRGTSELDSA